MAMTQNQAETFVTELIDLIRTEFYGGGQFVTGGGLVIVPQVVVDSSINVNAGLAPASGADLCVEVTTGLLSIADDATIKFGIAHELGHAFSAALLTNLGLQNVSGAGTEVVADLGSAYILHLNGVSWSDLTKVVQNGAQTRIFDLGWSGQHPPADQRSSYVRRMIQDLKQGKSRDESIKSIINSVKQNPASKSHGNWCKFKQRIKSAVSCFRTS